MGEQAVYHVPGMEFHYIFRSFGDLRRSVDRRSASGRGLSRVSQDIVGCSWWAWRGIKGGRRLAFSPSGCRRSQESSLDSSERCLNIAHGAGRVISCTAGELLVLFSCYLVFKDSSLRDVTFCDFDSTLPVAVAFAAVLLTFHVLCPIRHLRCLSRS